MQTRALVGALAVGLVVSGGGCADAPSTEAPAPIASAPAPLRSTRHRPKPHSPVERELSVHLRLPDGLALAELALVGERITIGRGAEVRTQDGFATVANVGRGATSLDDGARTGRILSKGPVQLDRGVKVHGDVTSESTVRSRGAQVEGAVREHVPAPTVV